MRRARIALRPAVEADRDFLRELFASTWADDPALARWPDSGREQFLDSQFALQHAHFMAHHANGAFLIVTRRDAAIGRFYLDRTGPLWRVLDITIAAATRDGGVGSLLLRWLQDRARAANVAGIDLHVLRTNARAARLYARSGFVEAIGASATHRRMVWSSRVS